MKSYIVDIRMRAYAEDEKQLQAIIDEVLRVAGNEAELVSTRESNNILLNSGKCRR